MFQFPCIKGYSQGTAVQMFSFSIVKGTLDHCLIDINSFRFFDRHTQPSLPNTKPYGRQPCLYFSLRPSLLPGQHSALQKIWPKTTNTSPQNLQNFSKAYRTDKLLSYFGLNLVAGGNEFDKIIQILEEAQHTMQPLNFPSILICTHTCTYLTNGKSHSEYTYF